MKIGELRSPIPKWDHTVTFTLQDVYYIELTLHFIIVLAVSFIFFWMCGVRYAATKEQLEEAAAAGAK